MYYMIVFGTQFVMVQFASPVSNRLKKPVNKLDLMFTHFEI